MKLSKLVMGVAAASMASASYAAPMSGVLAGSDSDGTAATGSGASAIAVIVPGDVGNAFKQMQGITGCDGDNTAACAPSISSAELRSILNSNAATAGAIGSGGNDLFTNLSAADTSTAATKSVIRTFYGADVVNALAAFNGAPPCGSGNALRAVTTPGLDDAGILAEVNNGNAKVEIGFVHAANMDDSTYDNVGFLKLDGVSPSLAAVSSSNYNLVANVYNAPTGGYLATESSTNGMTVGAVDAAAGGVAVHGGPSGATAWSVCSALETGPGALDINGGTI